MSGLLDIKNDSLWKLMWQMSLPGIMGMLLVSINTFVDALYISYLIGEEALAGVSLIIPLTLFTNAVMVLIASGSASILSRAIGAGDRTTQQKVLSNLVAMSLIASIVLVGAGIFFSNQLIKWMGASGKILNYAVNYYDAWVWGTFFIVFGIAANGLIRAEGKIKEAMKFTMVSVILNSVLAPLLMHTGELGIAGAGWASTLSMAIYAALTLRYFLSGKASFDTGKIRFRVEKEMFKEVITVGFSAFFLQLSTFIRQTFIFKSMAHYGSDKDLAFLTAVFRIVTFCIIPVFGLLQMLQPVVGINYGARNYDRCVKAVYVFRTGSILFLLLVGVPFMLFPAPVMSLMMPGRNFSAGEIYYFRMLFAVMPLLPVASSTLIFLQATGNGKRSSRMLLGRELLFIPLILLLPLIYGASGVYYSLVFENVLYFILVMAVSFHEFRKLRNIPSAGIPV